MLRVVAEQFIWHVHYPGADGRFGRTALDLITPENPLGLDRSSPDGRDDLVMPNELHLPIDRPVVIQLSSKDVIHSFGVHAMRVKQDVIPGLLAPVWFTPTVAGRFDIACSQLRGLGHYRMRGEIVVESQAEYEALHLQNRSWWHMTPSEWRYVVRLIVSTLLVLALCTPGSLISVRAATRRAIQSGAVSSQERPPAVDRTTPFLDSTHASVHPRLQSPGAGARTARFLRGGFTRSPIAPLQSARPRRQLDRHGSPMFCAPTGTGTSGRRLGPTRCATE